MQAGPAANPGPLVLIVDDQPDVRLAFGFMLSASGFQVAEAGDAETALSFLARKRVDVLLTDIALPDMDGIALLRLVRESSPPHPILIAYTGYSFSKTDRALELADAVLVKPVSCDQLLRTIKQATPARKQSGTSGRRVLN
jgi:CheY-like chemotaxis protein